MSETDIAAQLAKSILDDTPPTSQPVPQPVNTDISHNPVQIDAEALTNRAIEYFEVGRAESHTEKAQFQIRTILEWAGQIAQSEDHTDVMLVIARAEREMGLSMKPNRLGLLYRFVKLNQQSQNIQKELELLSYGAE